jgi:hypothetical protein
MSIAFEQQTFLAAALPQMLLTTAYGRHGMIGRGSSVGAERRSQFSASVG